MEKIAFIGSGNMASAISGGIVSSGLVEPSCIYLYDKNTNQYQKFDNNCVHTESISSAVDSANYIFLSVKPQNIKEVLDEIKNSSNLSEKVFISICAGITISSIENVLGKVKIIRVMPNTPLLIGHGVSALCRNEVVTNEDFEVVNQFFSSSGYTITVNEDDINNITAISGSAPAYVYLFIKLLCDGAKKLGFNNEKTTEIICNVFEGSAKMVLSSDKSVEELIAMVKSPNGTTEKALNVFENSDIDIIIYNSLDACANRADEISNLN